MPYISCVCRIDIKKKDIIKYNLQIQCNLLQGSNDICYSRKSATVHTEVKSSQTTTRLLIKYSTVTKYHISRPRSLLQSHSDKDSTALEQNQTYTPVKYNRRSQSNSM